MRLTHGWWPNPRHLVTGLCPSFLMTKMTPIIVLQWPLTKCVRVLLQWWRQMTPKCIENVFITISLSLLIYLLLYSCKQNFEIISKFWFQKNMYTLIGIFVVSIIWIANLSFLKVHQHLTHSIKKCNFKSEYRNSVSFIFFFCIYVSVLPKSGVSCLKKHPACISILEMYEHTILLSFSSLSYQVQGVPFKSSCFKKFYYQWYWVRNIQYLR